MAYIGNQPSPSNVDSTSIKDGSIQNADIDPNAAIEISKLDGVTATNTELNKLDGVSATTADLNITAGADAAGISASDIQKTQYLSNVTSDVQTQLTNAAGASVKGTLTKSFAINETSTIALSAASTPTPIISVTKEIPQVGVSAKGNWDVRSDGSNYEIEDSAPNVSITPSVADDDGIFTLGSGSFAATDVGKRIKGNGGEAVLKTTGGAYELVTAFADTSTIAAGDWEMYGLNFDAASGLKMSGFYQNSIEPGSVSDVNIIRRTRLPSYQQNVYTFHYREDVKEIWVQGHAPLNMIQKYTLDNNYDFTEVRVSATTACAGGMTHYPIQLEFNPDGSKVFFIGGEDENISAGWASGTNKIITQYDLTEDKYDLENQSVKPTSWFDNNYRNEFDTCCIRFVPDGSKYFIFGGTLGTIQGFTASVNGEIRDDDAIITANVLDVSGQIAAGANRTFNKFRFVDNGYKIFISDYSGATMFRYDMTTAYDLNTASYVGSTSIFSTISDFHINSDGTKMMYMNNAGRLNIINMSTAYDLTSFGSVTQSLDFTSTTYMPGYQLRDMQWSSDGNYLFAADDQANKIQRFDASEAWNIKSLYQYIDNMQGTSTKADKYRASSSVVAGGNSLYGIALKPDGTKLYVTEKDNENLVEVSMTTAYDLSTATQSYSYTTGAAYYNPEFIRVFEKEDGTGVVYWGAQSSTQSYPPYLMRHTLSTAWDLSTIGSLGAISLQESTNNLGQGQEGLAFNEAGTSFYRQTGLSTYNVELTRGDNAGQYYYRPILNYSFTDGAYGSTVTLNEEVTHETVDYNMTYDDQPHNNALNPFQFTPDGLSMFVTGQNYNAIWETKLNASFSIDVTDNLRTQSSFGYQSVGTSTTHRPNGIEISTDGTKLFVLESQSNTAAVLKRYSMTTPFDLTTMNTTPDQTYNVFTTAASNRYHHGLRFDPTGKYCTMLYRNGSSYTWRYLRLTNPYDLSSGVQNSNAPWALGVGVTYSPYGVSNEINQVQAFWFSHDGATLGAALKDSTGTTIRSQFWRLNRPYDTGSQAASLITTSNTYALNNANGDYYGGLEFDYRRKIAYHTWAVSDYYAQNSYDNWVNDRGNPLDVLRWSSPTYPNPASPTNNNYRSNWTLVGSRVRDMALSSDGRYLFTVGEYGGIYRVSVAGEYLKDVTPHDQYFTAVTNNTGQVDTSPWTDINSMTASEGGQGQKFYAFSTDARTTFKIVHNTNGTRNIVRNNSGTWQYNSNTTYGSETWANATSNNQFAAFREAMAVEQNRMDANTLSVVSDANFFAAGDTFDLAIILRSSQGQLGSPSSDGVSVNYDAAALNKGAILGTDYDYDVPSSTSVRITSLKAQNLKVKVL